MGILQSLNSSSLVYLKPVHVFGRDPNVADYLLTTHLCSRMHSVIRWQSGRWRLIDESRNGSYVNGEPIKKGQGVALSKGDIIAFSSLVEDKWRFSSDAMPKPALVALNGTRFLELQALNILPDEAAPECQILRQEQTWMFEKEDDYRALFEGSEVFIDSIRWKFYPNHVVDETEFRGKRSPEKPTLIFNVSRSEEHVQLVLEVGSSKFDLGHKTHHYLLLEMARHSLADTTTNDNDKGWMDNDLLLHNLKIDINHLNIQIYRARKSIRKHSDLWGQNIIGRRRGEIRLHPCNIIINKEYL